MHGDPCCPGPHEPGRPGASRARVYSGRPGSGGAVLAEEFWTKSMQILFQLAFRATGGRLSGSLSGFRFLGNQVWDRQTAGSLSACHAPLTPCCSSRAPLALSPRTQKDAPVLGKAQWEHRGRPRLPGWTSGACLWAADPRGPPCRCLQSHSLSPGLGDVTRPSPASWPGPGPRPACVRAPAHSTARGEAPGLTTHLSRLGDTFPPSGPVSPPPGCLVLTRPRPLPRGSGS